MKTNKLNGLYNRICSRKFSIYDYYIFDYKVVYLLTHLNIFIEEIYLRIKWAWQRVFRGYDDRTIWSLDHYLANMIPIWMKALKDSDRCVPFSMFINLEKDDRGNPTEESFEIGRNRWKEILMNIADGFAAYKEMDLYLDDAEKLKDLKITFDRAFNLFKEYFENLWL